MTREWKPGDVAASKHAGISVVVPKCDKHFARGPHWHHLDGGWDQLNDALSLGKFRPLVVIDPESTEDIERLFAALHARIGMATLADALRELADPTPKPDEPMGIGAVVEDNEGERWIVTAVKVLSEGVRP